MKRVEITDGTAEEAFSKTYDCFIVGIGNESRTEFVLKQLIDRNVKIRTVLALYYSNVRDQRRSAISEQLKRFPKGSVIEETVESDGEQKVYELLRNKFTQEGEVEVLIDYSSMSRVWYAAIILWFREAKILQPCLTFIYSEGKYTEETARKEVVIGDIRTVPGCEGEAYKHSRTASILGLGFYGYMSLCVCEQMEPDIIYTILTPENPVEGFDIAGQEGNKELINRAAGCFYVPLLSVESAYRCMMDIAAQHLAENDEVTIVPMGPKPHVLAAILVALTDQRICTLRVKHDDYGEDVRPSGAIVSTEVKFVELITPSKLSHS